MYFKISIRKNPETGELSGYYRLVESYRNQNDRVCHRTILNIGYLEGVKADLTYKVKHTGTSLFENPGSTDKSVVHKPEFKKTQTPGFKNST